MRRMWSSPPPGQEGETVIRVEPFFRWYDLWIGAYWDRATKTLYVCPLPMVGVRIRRA